MKISQAFPSTFISAQDLHGRGDVRLVIRSISNERVSDDEEKPTLFFNGTEKGLPLNKTNAMMIADAYGDDTDGWLGLPIILYEEKVPFKGKPTPAVRVKIPPRQVQQQQPNGNGYQQPPPPNGYQQHAPPQQHSNGYQQPPQQQPQYAPPPNGNGYGNSNGYAENPGAGMSQRDPNEPPF